MSDTLAAALIAATVALLGVIANSVGTEWFKRRQDRRAIAAAIAGELASYEPAWPLLQAFLESTKEAVHAGHRRELILRPFEKPRDVVYEKALEKLGLLGPHLVERIVYVYANINAFRENFVLIQKHGREMSDDELLARCQACLDSLDRANSKGRGLVDKLRFKAGY